MLFSFARSEKRLKFPPSFFFFAFDIHPVVGLLLLAFLREHGGANREFAQGDLRRYSS